MNGVHMPRENHRRLRGLRVRRDTYHVAKALLREPLNVPRARHGKLRKIRAYGINTLLKERRTFYITYVLPHVNVSRA
jgi:hypothetical protein